MSSVSPAVAHDISATSSAAPSRPQSPPPVSSTPTDSQAALSRGCGGSQISVATKKTEEEEDEEDDDEDDDDDDDDDGESDFDIASTPLGRRLLRHFLKQQLPYSPVGTHPPTIPAPPAATPAPPVAPSQPPSAAVGDENDGEIDPAVAAVMDETIHQYIVDEQWGKTVHEFTGLISYAC